MVPSRIGILEGSLLHDEGDREGLLAFTNVTTLLEKHGGPDLAMAYVNLAFCHLELGNLTDAHLSGERRERFTRMAGC